MKAINEIRDQFQNKCHEVAIAENKFSYNYTRWLERKLVAANQKILKNKLKDRGVL